jgi:hypothetical protein
MSAIENLNFLHTTSLESRTGTCTQQVCNPELELAHKSAIENLQGTHTAELLGVGASYVIYY